MKKLIVVLFCIINQFGFSQAFEQGTIVGTIGMGAPHLVKATIKAITRSQRFDDLFHGKIVVKNFTGLNPVLYKAEWGFKKYFGLGLSGGVWTMNFAVEDHYNVLKAGQITGTDSLDTYKFHVTSTAIGIRPNVHIPLKNQSVDVYLGMGLGFCKNKLTVDFSSTDVNRVFPNQSFDLSLPGFLYLSPTIGLRKYFGKYIGLNFELGYDRGALISGGLAMRFNYKPKS